MHLAKRNVLITRPSIYAQTLKKRLEKLGAVVCTLPTIEFVQSRVVTQAIEAVDQLDQCFGVIFVSQAAVQYAFDYIQARWPRLPVVNWFAIGPATASALAKHGIEQIVLPEKGIFNSAALLALPCFREAFPKTQNRFTVQDQQAQDKPIEKTLLIFCGNKTGADLPNGLRERGFTVECVSVYERQIPMGTDVVAKQIFSEQPPELMITTSYETVSNLWDSLSKTAQNYSLTCPILVVGRKSVEFVQKKGFQLILESPGAQDNVILNTIRYGHFLHPLEG